MQIILWYSCQLFWDLSNKIGMVFFIFSGRHCCRAQEGTRNQGILYLWKPRNQLLQALRLASERTRYTTGRLVFWIFHICNRISVSQITVLWYSSFQQALTSMASDLTEEMTLVASTVESPVLPSPPPFTNRPPGPGLPMSAEFKKEGDSHSTTFPKRFKPPYS